MEEMHIHLPPARYVVAVSGGVDSTVLLELLVASGGHDLHVAHFNHNWSSASDEYEAVARRQAERLELPFYAEKQTVSRSEAVARAVRYEFLRRIQRQTGADAIVTAHHADDLIETVILNVQRGTGRRGLAPFRQDNRVIRPLLSVPKSQLLAYAQAHELTWVEDISNTDTRLKRNAVRHQLIPGKLQENREYIGRVAGLSSEAAKLNHSIDRQLTRLITLNDNRADVSRSQVSRMSYELIAELIVHMANAVRPGTELNRRTVERLAIDIKTGRFTRPRNLIYTLSAVPTHDTVAIVFDAL